MIDSNNMYCTYPLKLSIQTDPVARLAFTAVLYSKSGKYKIRLNKIDMQGEDFDGSIFCCEQTAEIVDVNENVVETLFANGVPEQCYGYFSSMFEEFLKGHDDAIYLKPNLPVTGEELLKGIQPNAINIIQYEVDDWIQSIGQRYFNELTNMSNLVEEVGEVARLIGREYGEQSFKENEKPECVKIAIADELADVLFIVTCLANQMNIDLGSAFTKNLEKKTKRDRTRHLNNEKL